MTTKIIIFAISLFAGLITETDLINASHPSSGCSKTDLNDSGSSGCAISCDGYVAICKKQSNSYYCRVAPFPLADGTIPHRYDINVNAPVC